MEEHPIRQPQADPHWGSVVQFGLSLLGTLALWGLALMLGLMVFNAVLAAGGLSDASDAFPLLLMATGFGFTGILLLPSAGLAFLRVIHRPSPTWLRLRQPGWLILGALALVGVGYLTSKNTLLTWTLLPIIHVSATGLAVLWLITLGIRGLPVGSKQRSWGIFSAGMVIAPGLSLVVELVVIVGISFAGLTYLARDPAVAQDLMQLSEGYMANPDQSPDAILAFLEPFWNEPAVLFGVLLVVAVMVPLVEELFKPVGVWLVAGKGLTPAQGFAAGILSGAGFGLFETFTLSATSGEDWSLLVLARIGTSIIHVVTTGVTGWGLALAWQEKRYMRLGLAYLMAVAIHAIWNGLVVLTVIGEFWPDPSRFPQFLVNIGKVSPIGFLILLVGAFGLLLGSNKALRRAIIPPAGLEDTAGTATLSDEGNPESYGQGTGSQA